VRSVERFTGNGIIELIRIVLLMVGVTVILFYSNVRLAVISMLPMIPLMWITTDFGRRIGDYFFTVDVALGALSSRLQENVTGVQVVRAFAREIYEIERYAKANRALYHARLAVINEG
jgi:ATP-binding cassette subfamily B protein